MYELKNGNKKAFPCSVDSMSFCHWFDWFLAQRIQGNWIFTNSIEGQRYHNELIVQIQTLISYPISILDKTPTLDSSAVTIFLFLCNYTTLTPFLLMCFQSSFSFPLPKPLNGNMRWDGISVKNPWHNPSPEISNSCHSFSRLAIIFMDG